MVEDYKSKIQEVIGTVELLSKSIDDLSGTYLFFSYDLVNSTYYKNKEIGWSKVFRDFFKDCKKKVQDSLKRATLWKMVGDEILFYLPILEESELYHAPRKIYAVMCESISKMHKEHESTRGTLSIKATMWAAYVNDSEISDKDVDSGNVIIKERIVDNINLDFLGPDIDIGFRISKFALQAKLVIDAKLACLLTKLETDLKEKNISDYMRVVSYEKLKGVWEHRHYPIVWYQARWDSLDNMFLYDEKFGSDIVKRIVDSSADSLLPVSILTKIFADLNKFSEIESLRSGIKKYKEQNPIGFKTKKIPTDRLSELHLVAVCFNKTAEEILIAKRATNKDDFSETWEFGCAQLHLNQSFQQALIEGYKDDFNMDLSFFEPTLSIIGQYEFTKSKEGDRIVPGIIFVAKIDSEGIDIDQIDKTKHSDIKWVNEKTAAEISKEKVVPDFHKRIADAYNYIKNL